MNAVKEQFVSPSRRIDSAKDFRSLEVRDREASIDLIRAAAIRQVRRSRQLADSMMFDDGNAHVASILASAYRLLDPRRRKTRMERVNLSPLCLKKSAEATSTVAAPLIVFDATVDLDAEDAVNVAGAGEQSSDPSIGELRSMLTILRSQQD